MKPFTAVSPKTNTSITIHNVVGDDLYMSVRDGDREIPLHIDADAAVTMSDKIMRRAKPELISLLGLDFNIDNFESRVKLLSDLSTHLTDEEEEVLYGIVDQLNTLLVELLMRDVMAANQEPAKKDASHLKVVK